MCIKELLKKIKDLESEKQKVVTCERASCTVTYQTDEDKITTDYDFATTRSIIAKIDDEIRLYRHLVNLANATVIVPEFNMTIDNCLIEMAQLNNEIGILNRMRLNPQKKRSSTYNGMAEYTEVMYSLTDCESLLSAFKDKVTKLQLAIDKINLTYDIMV